MAEATATADSGLVRIQRRAWTTSRGCWRLVVLLGLAWVALLVLGGTAHAAPTDDKPAPAVPDAIPLLGQALANVGTLTAALPLDGLPQPVTHAVQGVTKTATATVAVATEATAKTASAAAGAAPAYLPAAEGVDAVQHLADAVAETAGATAAGEKLLDARVPSIATLVTPVAGAAAEQIDTTAHLAVAAAAALTAPIPVTHPLTGALAPAVGSALAALDATTDVLTASSSAVAAIADTVVGATAGMLAPVIAVVSAPAGSIAVSGAGSGSGAGAGDAPAPQAGVPAIIQTTDSQATGLPVSPLKGNNCSCPDAPHAGSAVPPPDAGINSLQIVAQPASDTATVLPVPVSGAGSTTGNGGPAPTPVLDQTLVRVESEPEFADDATDPIDGPTGPMPGTPAADPAFSPD